MARANWASWGFVLAAASLLPATPAMADAIDGDWCHGPASLRIDGPDVHTPGGKDIKGDYDRHAFHYIVPAGEKDEGSEILIQLMSDDEMVLIRRISGADSPAETWQRCQPVT
jgi:hypothetical protein